MQFLPFIAWLKNYKKGYLVRDLIAGITIAVVLIPQSMSYAMIAGIPPVYGLYAAALPPIIAALWGRSSLLATGPVAMVSLLVFTSIIPFEKPGSPEFISIAIMLALMVGVIQILMGVFKLGFLMRFVSHPVIVGFTNAAAIIIAATQVKHILGIEVKGSEFIFQLFLEIGRNLADTNPYTLGVGILSFIIIIAGKKIHENFPGAMVASVATGALVYLAGLNDLGVKIVGEIPAGLPSPTLTLVGFETAARLVGPALVIAIIGFMEALAITKTVSKKIHEKVDVNQELIGQGAANAVGYLFGAYPVSGSFSRTAVNLQIGGKTALSNVFSGLAVIITLIFFTSAFYYLPNATLAAIVMSAVIGLVKHTQFIKLYKTNKTDGAVALITFAFAFITKPDYAIFIGIAVSLILFLWASMSPRVVVLARNPKTEIFENAETSHLPTCPQILFVRLDSSIYFANAEYITEDLLKKISERANGLKYVLLDMEAVNHIDATGVDELTSLLTEIKARGLELHFANIKQPVKEVLTNSTFIKLLEHTCCLDSKGDSIAMLFETLDHDFCKNRCPHQVFEECAAVK
ncbi:MAG: SulP family inorganic anion transporter [Candidatus Aquicultor sp.]|nr:SulP family inorganic anion transporter [Candidatus Aquicultor sp.]